MNRIRTDIGLIQDKNAFAVNIYCPEILKHSAVLIKELKSHIAAMNPSLLLAVKINVYKIAYYMLNH